MVYRVTLIPGDGIGPEVSAAVLRIIEAVGVQIEWERFIVGGHAQDIAGSSLPEAVLDSVRRNTVALKGPVATIECGEHRRPSPRLPADPSRASSIADP